MKLHNRRPDIENLYKVLRCEEPSRPTLFELFLNKELYEKLAGRPAPPNTNSVEYLRFLVDAFAAAGYDYATTYACDMSFETAPQDHLGTISLNGGTIITDRASYNAYTWPNPAQYDYSKLDAILPYLPEGMKLMIMGPGGVLENVMAIVGYDNLCYMLYEDEELLGQLFTDVGSRLVEYYRIAASYSSVGVLVSNDDWGFNTQTFFSPEVMRKYVFPWHKQIVDVIHAAGKPVVLHSCGFFTDVMEDVIAMGYDGKHSYEDGILSVEDSYEKWQGRIAIMGGIDVDFVIRQDADSVTRRAKAMLERTKGRGGYALGTGNSVPAYVPDDHYFALIKAALE